MGTETASAAAIRTDPAVRRAQEWLCLSGFSVVVDGLMGPATASALARFQRGAGLAATGRLDAATQVALDAPIVRATQARPAAPSLSETIVAVAHAHLAERPREIGGPNSGPWVRLYMDGHEGAPWAWCAGFACCIVRQACDAHGVPLPFRPSFGCDNLGAAALRAGRLVRGDDLAGVRARVRPGALFLVRRRTYQRMGWHHTGLVLELQRETFTTAEGNSNDNGSREGYEAIERTRALGPSYDFIETPEPERKPRDSVEQRC